MSSMVCRNARFFRKNGRVYTIQQRSCTRLRCGCQKDGAGDVSFTCIPRAWRNARSSRGCVRCAPCRLCSRRPSSSSRRIERTACSAAPAPRQWAEGWSPSWMKTRGRRSRKMRRRRSCGWRSMRQRASFGV
ncbi:hypothetical protein J3F84DRAFT_67833 [Trichoderma pleuroticola]